jgi:hypothetical protein
LGGGIVGLLPRGVGAIEALEDVVDVIGRDVAVIFVTAIFHRRYIRTQREFILEQRPWLDFVFVALAEWAACSVTSVWMSSRAQGAWATEVYAICFGLAIVTRYVLRKELLQDVRGLRREIRSDELR